MWNVYRVGLFLGHILCPGLRTLKSKENKYLKTLFFQKNASFHSCD